MKVVYICSLDGGGPLNHLRLLAPAMARQGFDVHVVCASDAVAATFRDRDVNASVAPMRHKLDMLAPGRLWPLLRGAHIVHTHDRRAGLFGRIVAKTRGARVIHTLHGLPEEIGARVGRLPASVPSPHLRGRWLAGGYMHIESALARLGAVVTPSQAMRRFLGEHGVALSRVRVIGHSIDVRRHAPRARTGTATFGVAARLEHWKGIDVLLAACAQTTQRMRVEIFGEGSQRRRLEAQAAALGVDARFHGDVADVRAHLDTLDAFVLPSRVENAPLAIVEAMANALPVIATRVGGVPELVADEQTGLLVEPDDPVALARALTRVAEHPGFAAQLGRAGALRAKTEMGEDVVALRMAQLYCEIAAAAHGSGNGAGAPAAPRVIRR